MLFSVRRMSLVVAALSAFSGGAAQSAEMRCSSAARVCFVPQAAANNLIFVQTDEACMQKCAKTNEACVSTAGENEISKQRCSAIYGECAAKCSPPGGQQVEP